MAGDPLSGYADRGQTTRAWRFMRRAVVAWLVLTNVFPLACAGGHRPDRELSVPGAIPDRCSADWVIGIRRSSGSATSVRAASLPSAISA
jgi:hypothetical protein